MNRIIFYQNLQVAISDEPETVAQIIYNNSYLTEALELPNLAEWDKRAISAKIDINLDKLHQIEQIAHKYEQRHNNAYSWRTIVKRVLGALTIGLVLASVVWLQLVRSNLWQFVKAATTFALVLVILFIVFAALEYCFRPSKQYDPSRDEDLLTMDKDEFKAKYGSKL